MAVLLLVLVEAGEEAAVAPGASVKVSVYWASLSTYRRTVKGGEARPRVSYAVYLRRTAGTA
jgi:hypothetical protein